MIWFKPSLCYLYHLIYFQALANYLHVGEEWGLVPAPDCYVKTPFSHSNSLGRRQLFGGPPPGPSLLFFSWRVSEISKQDKGIKPLTSAPERGRVTHATPGTRLVTVSLGIRSGTSHVSSPSQPLLIAGLCSNDQEGPESRWISLVSLASLDS